jgi:hypothetical protein
MQQQENEWWDTDSEQNRREEVPRQGIVDRKWRQGDGEERRAEERTENGSSTEMKDELEGQREAKLENNRCRKLLRSA